jgi:hypothetical protein
MTRIAALWLLIAAGITCAQESKTPSKPDAQADVAMLAGAYKADMDEVAADYEKWFTALQKWYLASLEKLQGERMKAGDLDGVLAFKAERERIAARAETTQEQIQAMPAALGKLRAAYEPALKKIMDEAARRKDAARSKRLAKLEALQKRLTINGDLDEALLVKKEKERAATGTADTDGGSSGKPLEAPASPATAGSTKPAEPDKEPGAVRDAAAPLIGTWRLAYAPTPAWSAKMTLKADGSFAIDDINQGKWKMTAEGAVLTYDSNGLQDKIPPPFDPKGTKVHGRRGKDYTAMKIEP